MLREREIIIAKVTLLPPSLSSNRTFVASIVLLNHLFLFASTHPPTAQPSSFEIDSLPLLLLEATTMEEQTQNMNK